MSTYRARWIAALFTFALVAAACSDEDAAPETTDASSQTEETASTTVPADTTPTTIADATVIEASVAGGTVSVDSDRVAVETGTEIRIVIESDVNEHVHVHGYDILADVTPDGPAEIVFTADIPGLFEVELEDSGNFLFEIEVRS